MRGDFSGKQRNRDGLPGSQDVQRRIVERSGNLPIDNFATGYDPFGTKGCDNIHRQISAMQMQHRTGYTVQSFQQRLSVSARDFYWKPGGFGCLSRRLADAKGLEIAPLGQINRPADGICRSEDQSLKASEFNIHRHVFNLHQRRDGNRCLFAKRGVQHIPKSDRLRLWTRQKKVFAGIACHSHRCYLPSALISKAELMVEPLKFLGIESSCDDTAAAVLQDSGVGRPDILSSVVYGQIDLHADFGGVVPEIAARAHAEKLDLCVAQALAQADCRLDQLDGIAVTAGPGLIGGVLSGVMCARGIAAGAGLSLIAVNHLAGHALTPGMTDGIQPPYLMLLVSGGHCQFLAVLPKGIFRRLGGTIDDAPGEAFDKTARLLGLSQPGGPAVESAAKGGNPGRFVLPRPLLDRADCDMSFSGLKTALRRQRDQLVADQGGLFPGDVADLAAAFQTAVADVLAEKTRRAIAAFRDLTGEAAPVLAVAGGVAANLQIRAALNEVAADEGLSFTAPPLAYCTDNAAMIAWAGICQHRDGTPVDPAFSARPRWPLDQLSTPMIGSGKKGAKA